MSLRETLPAGTAFVGWLAVGASFLPERIGTPILWALLVCLVLSILLGLLVSPATTAAGAFLTAIPASWAGARLRESPSTALSTAFLVIAGMGAAASAFAIAWAFLSDRKRKATEAELEAARELERIRWRLKVRPEEVTEAERARLLAADAQKPSGS